MNKEPLPVDERWRHKYDKKWVPPSDDETIILYTDSDPVVEVEVVAPRGMMIAGFGSRKAGETFKLPRPLADKLVAEYPEQLKIVSKRTYTAPKADKEVKEEGDNG